MEIVSDPKVVEVFDAYPPDIRPMMNNLRQLILDIASETEGLDKILETLKWGEPSYVVKKGSTIRIDWKKNNPGYCAIYFICSTNLVSTFRLVYGDALEFQENRAILLPLHGTMPTKEIKHCISMALTYHRIKHLPLLGA